MLDGARQSFATPRRSELTLQLIEQDSVALLTIPRLDDLALAARFAECFEPLAS